MHQKNMSKKDLTMCLKYAKHSTWLRGHVWQLEVHEQENICLNDNQ